MEDSEVRGEILTRLGRIEGKQDASLASQIRVEATLGAHDARLRMVEQRQSRIFGLGAGALALWGMLVGYIKFGGGA